jgi:hypothetical protein
MSFVEWVTLLALLVVGSAGLYAGILSLVGKQVGQGQTPVANRRARFFSALLYLSGGGAALIVAILWLVSRPG